MDRQSRKKLIEKAVSGDTEAFSKLYEQIYKQLYYYALANLRNTEDAADAVQDAVLDGFTGISALRDWRAFDSWLFAILVAKIKKKQKENAERLACRDNALQVEAVIKDTKEYERCEIVEEFAGLKEEERLCLTLSLIAGYRPRQISEITGINQSTVRSYISRGKKKLRKGLSE